MADRGRRSLRLGLAALAGLFALPFVACGSSGFCASKDDPYCTEELDALTFVTTCTGTGSVQECTEESEVAALDALCRTPSGCALSGAAQKTTGLTEDTTGVLLQGGSLALPADLGRFEAAILAATSGDGDASVTVTQTCGVCPNDDAGTPVPAPGACPQAFDVSPSYGWVSLLVKPCCPCGPGVRQGTLVLRGTGIQIIDVRFSEQFSHPVDSGGCL